MTFRRVGGEENTCISKRTCDRTGYKKLLQAQKTAADQGDVKGVLSLSKELIKLAHKFGQKIVEISTEKSEQYSDAPPNECEEDITGFE